MLKMYFELRPPLKKSLFPVQRVAEIMAGNLVFVENGKKRSQSALIDSPGRLTGNNIFSKGGLIISELRS